MSLTPEKAKAILLDFDWGNYGLDDMDRRVNPDLSDEWATELGKLLSQASTDEKRC